MRDNKILLTKKVQDSKRPGDNSRNNINNKTTHIANEIVCITSDKDCKHDEWKVYSSFSYMSVCPKDIPKIGNRYLNTSCFNNRLSNFSLFQSTIHPVPNSIYKSRFSLVSKKNRKYSDFFLVENDVIENKRIAQSVLENLRGKETQSAKKDEINNFLKKAIFEF